MNSTNHFSLTKSELKTFIVSGISGSLELYDFIIYIFFANIIAELFFNTKSEISALLLTFTIYATGYLARILGGFLFSSQCDKKGRKNSFSLTIFMMAISTFAIGCLPTYQSVGITATILLTVCRLIQGLALGAGLPCSLTFVYEHAKETHKAFACSIICMSIAFGVFLGSFVGSLMTEFISPKHLLSYGWRIPFMIGGVLGIIGVYLRQNLKETPVFIQMAKIKNENFVPLKFAFEHEKVNILHTVFIILISAVTLVLTFLFSPVYLQVFYHFSSTEVLVTNSIFILFYAALIPIFGLLCNQHSEKKVFLIATSLLTLSAVPLYMLLKESSLFFLCAFYFIFAIISAAIKVSSMTILAKQFMPKIRYTGISISYNLAFGVIGGFTPLIATTLIDITKLNYAPSFYLGSVSLFAFIACLSSKVKEKEMVQTE